MPYVHRTNGLEILLVDFDGVLADYREGFKGEGVLGAPIPGALEWLKLLCSAYEVHIWSCRDHQKITEWLYQHRAFLHFDLASINFTEPGLNNEPKPYADFYLGDDDIFFQARAFTFHGEVREHTKWQWTRDTWMVVGTYLCTRANVAYQLKEGGIPA